jgi:hypothetical protein
VAEEHTLAEFLIKLGFAVDPEGKARYDKAVDDAHKAAEKAKTGSAEAIEAAAKAADGVKTSAAAAEAATAMAVGSIVGSLAAGMAAVLSAVRVLDGQFLQLYNTSLRINVAVDNIRSIGAAADLTGSSLEAMTGALESFSQKMRSLPAFEGMVQSRFGVQTRDAAGQPRDNYAILSDVAVAERSSGKPYYQQLAEMKTMGVGEREFQSLADPRTRALITDGDRVTRDMGVDMQRFAESANGFMMSWAGLMGRLKMPMMSLASNDGWKRSIDNLNYFWDSNAKLIRAVTEITGDVITGALETITGLFRVFATIENFLTHGLLGSPDTGKFAGEIDKSIQDRKKQAEGQFSGRKPVQADNAGWEENIRKTARGERIDYHPMIEGEGGQGPSFASGADRLVNSQDALRKSTDALAETMKPGPFSGGGGEGSKDKESPGMGAQLWAWIRGAAGGGAGGAFKQGADTALDRINGAGDAYSAARRGGAGVARSLWEGGKSLFGGGGHAGGGAGAYNAASAAALIRKAGGTEEEARMLGAIAMAESSGRPGAHNTNAGTGDNSYGLWQVNMLGKMGPERLAHYGLKSNDDLFDPSTNARVALQMSRENHGYKDWSTFRHGEHAKYLQDAARGAGDNYAGLLAGEQAPLSNRGASDAGVDHRLTDIMSAAASELPPGFTIKRTSGFRPGDSGAHGRGLASDFQIYDPQGNPIRNRGSDDTHLYETLARAALREQQQRYPELNHRLAWGGNFGTEKGGGGENDLMHYDIMGDRGSRGPSLWNRGPLPPREQPIAKAPRPAPVSPNPVRATPLPEPPKMPQPTSWQAHYPHTAPLGHSAIHNSSVQHSQNNNFTFHGVALNDADQIKRRVNEALRQHQQLAYNPAHEGGSGVSTA